MNVFMVLYMSLLVQLLEQRLEAVGSIYRDAYIPASALSPVASSTSTSAENVTGHSPLVLVRFLTQALEMRIDFTDQDIAINAFHRPVG